VYAYNAYMRIIAGELKGREILLPKGSRIRPATGFVRELLMNLLTPDWVQGSIFLDICAGSGLVGFEALSRGAARVIFVEANMKTAAQIRETAERFGVRKRITVLQRDARHCFNLLRKTLDGTSAHTMFLDPPYIPSMAEDLLFRCGMAVDLLAPGGTVIIRTPDDLPQIVPGLLLRERRDAGNGALWLYEPCGETASDGAPGTDEVADGG
jgi:16S rRNA (guanine966-N2)-methyltransferase